MKKMFLKPTVLALVVASSLISCKKNGVTSKTEFLTQKAWKYEAYGLDVNKNNVIDASENELVTCESDDTYAFSANGTVTQTDNAQKCDPNDPATITLPWMFKNNETEIDLFGHTAIITTLNDTKLEVYMNEPDGSGGTLKFISIFKH